MQSDIKVANYSKQKQKFLLKRSVSSILFAQGIICDTLCKEWIVITKEDIESYIERIPPAPEAVRQTLALLQAGELRKAAAVASEERALAAYLRNLVNKPIYGFKNEVKDAAQIFSILGVGGSVQTVYNYMMNLLSPKEWRFFKLNHALFNDLQADLSAGWNKILTQLDIEDQDVEAAVALLPSAVIVAEALFNAHKSDVELIRSAKDIDLSTILKRLCGYTLFNISAMIAKKWDMPQKIADIALAASGEYTLEDKDAMELGAWMHLLLFYLLSKPKYIDAGLNDFLEFNVGYVEKIYEEFSQIMEIEV